MVQDKIRNLDRNLLKSKFDEIEKEFNLYNHKREEVLADRYLTAIYPKYLVEGAGLTLIGLVAFSLRGQHSYT